MAHHQERHGDVGVSLGDGPPEEILDHRVVLVLPSAIVGMQVDVRLSYSECNMLCDSVFAKMHTQFTHSTHINIHTLLYSFFTKAMMLKKIVELADHGVGPLPTVSSLIAEEVHLAGDGLTDHSEDSTLPRDQEVDRPWLERITGVVHL